LLVKNFSFNEAATMGHQMPPDDDPIIRGLREAGIRPLRATPGGGGGGRTGPSRAGRLLIAAVIFLVVMVMVVEPLVTRLADWLWFREIGFERVFLTKIAAQWTLGFLAAVFAFAVLYGTARIALSLTRPVVRDAAPRVGTSPAGRVIRGLLERGIGFAALIGSAFFAFFVGLGTAAQWRTVLQFMNRTPFGTTDPVFGRDVGYYVFTLPAIELALGVIGICVGIALFVIALPIHLSDNAVVTSSGRVTTNVTARRGSISPRSALRCSSCWRCAFSSSRSRHSSSASISLWPARTSWICTCVCRRCTCSAWRRWPVPRSWCTARGEAACWPPRRAA
jgi:hypothetical protein